MKFKAFKITNFRSIVDTGWCPFSGDNVTVLVGQNESGKSSILDALATTFNDEVLEDDDCRISAPAPLVEICIELEPEILLADLDANPPDQIQALKDYFQEKKNIVDFGFRWYRKEDGSGLGTTFDIDNGRLEKVLAPFKAAAQAEDERKLEEAKTVIAAAESEEERNKQPQIDKTDFLSLSDVTDVIFRHAPEVTLFKEETGLLPNRIDLVQGKDGKWTLLGEGSRAAENFLQIADINLDELVKGNSRTREYILRKANANLTADFALFWSQTIGKKEKLQLECDIANYGADAGKKAGEPHLVFWVSDGFNKLYPKQRSQGVRWFVSFYLQLKASQKRKGGQIFLLDEPGANLHAKAQLDVLRLINRLSGDVMLVYSTHSPTLVEYEKLYRVLAVQRDGEDGDSPTSVITAHKLGSASKDTLFPLFAAMGADLSQQQVIQKKSNVLLEEMSGFYYFKAIWHLLALRQEAFFIAATGVNNVEPLANMFMGWGIEFIVVVDDDQQGRSAYNSLKRHMFGDDEEVAKAAMYKIAEKKGIEDVFSIADFKKHVIEDDAADINDCNSQYVKDHALSKPVLGYKFWLKVSKGGLKISDLSNETKENVSALSKEILARLYPKQKKT